MTISNEKFLLICLDQKVGTINWNKVAAEGDIPSAGAASIRYRRLRKKVMDDQDEASAKESPKPNRKKAMDNEQSKKKSKTKKRKIELFAEDDDDDDEDVKTTKVKNEIGPVHSDEDEE